MPIEAIDRERAWPHRPVTQDTNRADWMRGEYDRLPIIRDMAAARELRGGDLSARLGALLDEARALSVDLRAARDAAPDGGKAGYRLANNRVEQAIAALARAAEVAL